MLPLFFSLSLLAIPALAHPLCPYNEKAVRARIAPAARAEMEGIREVFADFDTRFGKCLKVSGEKEPRLKFANAEIPWRATVDKKGRWTGLSFGPARFPQDSSQKLIADTAAAGAALLVREEGGGALSARGGEPIEVGETAHLLWLAEYRARLKEGKLKPSSVAETTASAGLLTLGPLLSWPAGVPLTLESAAQLAFRSRDNLAADLLLRGLSEKVNGKSTVPFAELARGGNRAAGWKHSLRELCEAALALKNDPAFPGGLGAAEERYRFYEFQGEFPSTYSVLHLSQATESGPWACAAVAFPKPSSVSFTRARDFLDRAYELRARLPQEALVKSR